MLLRLMYRLERLAFMGNAHRRRLVKKNGCANLMLVSQHLTCSLSCQGINLDYAPYLYDMVLGNPVNILNVVGCILRVT